MAQSNGGKGVGKVVHGGPGNFKFETRKSKLENGNWRMETGKWKLENGK
jgi:hypothetical protein